MADAGQILGGRGDAYFGSIPTQYGNQSRVSPELHPTDPLFGPSVSMTPLCFLIGFHQLRESVYLWLFLSCTISPTYRGTVILKLSPQAIFLITISLLGISMAFNPSAMPSFLSRFLRPFTSSTSLAFNSEPLSMQNFPENTQKATFASGCFWGVEHIFRKHYGNGRGLLDARVGYTGGGTTAPSYRAVCSGTTGHAESLMVLFDPDKVSYETLVEFFFRTHDPTTKNQQGADRGSQYRSAIFAHSEEQLRIAQEAKAEVQEKWKYTHDRSTSTVTTEVAMAGPWYDAEDYHQLYLHNNPGGYECAMHYWRDEFPPLFGNAEKAGEPKKPTS